MQTSQQKSKTHKYSPWPSYHEHPIDVSRSKSRSWQNICNLARSATATRLLAALSTRYGGQLGYWLGHVIVFVVERIVRLRGVIWFQHCLWQKWGANERKRRNVFKIHSSSGDVIQLRWACSVNSNKMVIDNGTFLCNSKLIFLDCFRVESSISARTTNCKKLYKKINFAATKVA